ncbi:MAG: cytochrome b [Pseudomonadota bacterium]
MGVFNSSHSYGGLTKLCHWAMVLVFAFQYVGAAIMTNIDWGARFLGLPQSFYYDWHKSVGLVALVIAIVRLSNRSVGRLPDWAPTITTFEQKLVHRMEQLLYLSMFLMPITGYLYVMSGGFGVLFFGVWKLPNPIGKWEAMMLVTKWSHIICSFVLLGAIIGHIGLVVRHQFVIKDNLLRRMLPARQS